MSEYELILKYIVTSKISGNWGAGDEHLTNLEMLIEIDRYENNEDRVILNLYNKLKESSDEWTEEKTEKYIDKLMEVTEKYGIRRPSWKKLRAEMIYEDGGKDEADHYRRIIIEGKGEEFMDKVDSLYWGLI